MVITAHQSQLCFDAWMQCEHLMESMAYAPNRFSKKLTKVIDECAAICMGSFHAIKTGSVNIGRIALLCVGICEECAEECASQAGHAFQSCAQVCRSCSEAMSMLAGGV